MLQLTLSSYRYSCGAFPYLLYVSIVGPTDKLLQLSQTVRFSQSKDQLRLHVRLPGFLSSHLEEFNQVFPIIYKMPITVLKPTSSLTQEITINVMYNKRVHAKQNLTALACCIDHLHVR